MSGTAVIRRAGPEDAERVHDLVHAAYGRWVDVLGRKPKPMRADYRRAVVAHAIDVMTADGVVVALLETMPVDDGLLIVNVAVAPAEQGRGYGRAVLAHAEDIAGALGLRSIGLYTNKLMATNLALYRRLGYEIEREDVTDAFGTVVHMRKAI